MLIGIAMHDYPFSRGMRYENYTLVLITSDRAARLSIQIAHYIDLINTCVTKCYLMVSEAIFIVKFNTRLQKRMKIKLKY